MAQVQFPSHLPVEEVIALVHEDPAFLVDCLGPDADPVLAVVAEDLRIAEVSRVALGLVDQDLVNFFNISLLV